MTAAAKQRDRLLRRRVDDRAGPRHARSQQDRCADDGGRETRFGDDALRAALRAQVPIGRLGVRAENADQHDARDSSPPAGVHDRLGGVDVGRLIAWMWGSRRECRRDAPRSRFLSARPPVLRDRRSRSRAPRFAGEAGRAAAARTDRTHATTWMSARSARWRSRMLPTPLLAPVIAMFTCLPICPSDAAPVRSGAARRGRTRSSQRPSADESCPMPGAVSRREGGRDCRALRRTPAASSLWPPRRDRVRPRPSPW